MIKNEKLEKYIYNNIVVVEPANLMFHPCCDALFIKQE